MSTETPLIAIIDDNEQILKSLSWLIESIGYQTKTFIEADTFLNEHQNQKWDCALIDIRMPKISGLELQSRLQEINFTTPIIFISAHGDIPMAVQAVRNGAFDFLPKPINNNLLLETLNKAISHNKNESVRTEQHKEKQKLFAMLTPREQEVMALMVNGYITKVIASKLDISPNTVEIHRAKIMRKMQAKTISELTKVAFVFDLVKAEEAVA